MENFVHGGKVLEFTVPSGGAYSGQPFLVGSAFGVSCGAYNTGDTGEMEVQGVFDLDMDSSNPTQGQTAYWDNSAKKVTTTATSNTKIGVFTVAGSPGTNPATGNTAGRVRLNGAF